MDAYDSLLWCVLGFAAFPVLVGFVSLAWQIAKLARETRRIERENERRGY